MGWSLSYRQHPDGELLDAVLLSAGRALYLANEFEAKCRYVLRIANLLGAMHDDPVLGLQEAIEAAPTDKMLGGTLIALGKGPFSLSTADLEVLDGARQARNFIAHEGASIGQLWSVKRSAIAAHVAKLRLAAADLAEGDNLISRWCFGIDEPGQVPPSELINAYPGMVDDWLFSQVDAMLCGRA